MTALRIASVLLAALGAATAGAGERVPLWPEGRIPGFEAHQFAAPNDEVQKPGFRPEEHRMPYLEWMDPPAASNAHGGVILLIPGGGYFGCYSIQLTKQWHRFFTDNGFQCVRLVYRTPRTRDGIYYRAAWQDGQRAVRLVRAEARRRGLDPARIGATGMSAGGHLTMLLATRSLTPAYEPVDAVDAEPCSIDFAMPGAVPYGLADSVGTPSTRNGNGIDCGFVGDFAFDAKTPPTCLFHGGSDHYAPEHSTKLYRELRKRKIPSELHLYADSGHGDFWSRDWADSAAGFIRQMNLDRRLGAPVALATRWPKDAQGIVPERQELWPKDRTPDVQTNQCRPYLEWWVPAQLRTKAVQIVYSGGGYNDNHPESWDGVPEARRFLNERGMAVVVLKYRTPRPKGGLAKHTTAWQDLQRCVRLVRQGAERRGLDPRRIGILGGSAGGHLTLMGATSSRSRSYWDVDAADKLSCDVQWAVATYPAYALTDGVNGPNAGGGNDDAARLVPEFAFDLSTCPILFLHGDADGYAAMNSVKCWEQLRRMGVQGELHTFAKCEHCFMIRTPEGTGAYRWLDRIWSFLEHKGFIRD